MSGIANVRIEKLTPENYNSWSGDIGSALKLSNLWPAIDGEVAERIAGTFTVGGVVMAPTSDDRTMDEKAMALMRINVSKELQVLVDCESTADKVWRSLKRTFRASLTTRLMELKGSWAGLRQGQSEGVVAFFSRATRVRLDLKEVGVVVTDLDFMTQIMFGLLPKFNNFVQNMVLTDMSSLSPGEFMNKMQWSESHLEKARGPSAPAPKAHQAEEEQRGIQCHECKQFGHYKRNCPQLRGKKPGGGGQGPAKCRECGKTGHTVQQCWKKHPHLRPARGKGKFAHHVEEEEEECSTSYSAEAYLSEAKYLTGRYNPADFMLLPHHFGSLDEEFGPHSLDGAAAVDGNNAQCPRFCSKEDSFCLQDLKGERLWLNAPFKEMKRFLEHYWQQKKLHSGNVSGTFVVPYRPQASWWPLVEQMTLVRTWPAGTQLFSMPDGKGGRKSCEPCHFEVHVYHDGASASAAVSMMLDSGATHHMMKSKSVFKSMQQGPKGGKVRVGDGGGVSIEGKGDVVVQPAEVPLVLRDALFVPGMRHNLVSVAGLTDEGSTVTFRRDSCTVETSEGVEYRGCREGNLYFLNPPEAAVSELDEGQLWHRRLGHLGYRGLEKLQACAKGIRVPAARFRQLSTESSLCGVCETAKQTRQPRVERTSLRATVPCHRLHTDLVGPLEVQSLGGKSYFQLTTDEATGYSVLKTLRTKDESPESLFSAIDDFERVSGGKKVKNVRSDRGKEFVNQTTEEEFGKRKIYHEPTPAYSPESNGVAERSNRTVLDKARSLLQDAGLPKSFWGEAVVHATLLKNISPVRHCAKTPWEMMSGSQPNLEGLAVFGSLAYVHVPADRRKKLDQRALVGVYLGTDLHSGLHRVYLNGGVRWEKDVRVDETVRGWMRVKSTHVGESDETGDSYLIFNIAPHEGQATEPGVPGPTGEDQQPVQAPGQAQQPEQPTGQDHGQPSGVGQQPTGQNQGEQPAGAQEDQEEGPVLRRSARASMPPVRFTVDSFAAVLPNDPLTFEEAKASRQSALWDEAMQEEYQALVENRTWDVVEADSVPKGQQVLPCKWVFKTKRGAQNVVERYKARVVAGGHRQKEGVDFNEVFAPVSKHATLRLLYSKVAADNLELHSLDISNAFLNGVLAEPVYMKLPKGYEAPGMVCKLKKTLYGLKQAPKEWYDVLSAAMVKLGFSCSPNDAALWYQDLPSGRVWVLHWVDDLQVAHRELAEVVKVKEGLLKMFKGKDLGETTRYLNMEVERDRAAGTLKMSQPLNVQALVGKLGLENGNPRQLPMSAGAEVQAWVEGDSKLEDVKLYSEVVGGLLYLSCCTRPDICYAVNTLARYMSRPTVRHFELVKGVVRYLLGTRDVGITFGSGDSVEGYTDADFAACKDTRRSRSGMVFVSHGGAVHWASKLQPLVTLSTAESEYVAGAYAAREAVWLGRVAVELQLLNVATVVLKCDNQSALHMAKNPADTSRTKHIELRHHYLRQCVQSGVIVMQFVPTDDNLADMFTKGLARDKLRGFLKGLGLL